MPKRRSSAFTTPTTSQSSTYSTSSVSNHPILNDVFGSSSSSKVIPSEPLSKLDEARVRAKRLRRNEKVYRIVQFLSTSTGTPHPPCYAFNNSRKDCACETKQIQRYSWISPDCSSFEKIELKECQLSYESRHFGSVESESELNRMIDALIDYEAVREAANSLKNKDDNNHMFNVLQKAFRELTRVINLARFTQISYYSSKDPISRYISNLQVDSRFIGTQADNPSIKKALCSFFLEQEASLGSLKAIFYRLGEYFILYLNNFVLKRPEKRNFALKENREAYQGFYTRWLACCIIPSTYASFTRYNLTDIFGNEFLSMIFDDFKNLIAKRLDEERLISISPSTSKAISNDIPYMEARLKYELLPQFVNFIEREFVGHVSAQFWQLSILGNDSTKRFMTTRNATHNCHSNELAGNLSLFSDMERFVERLKPLERAFEPSELEGVHLKPSITNLKNNNCNNSNGKSKKNNKNSRFSNNNNKNSFCWTNFLLDKCHNYLWSANNNEEDSPSCSSSHPLSPKKKSRYTHDVPVLRLVREPEPDLGIAIQTITRFILQTPQLFRSKSLWTYLTRDANSSKLHRLMRTLHEQVKLKHSEIKANTPCIRALQITPKKSSKSPIANPTNQDMIQYRLLQNTLDEDGLSAEQKCKWFVQLQNVINHQLPRMGREYVSRVVYDPRHITLIMFKKDTEHVIGGITFRLFQEQGFSEVVFCAVNSSEQVKGYGRRLMSFLKDYHIKELGIMHLLTFADEDAIGYFEKQGFTHVDLREERKRYPGCIKEYDGATLMGCWLNPLIVYSDMSHRVLFQKMLIKAIIKHKEPERSRIFRYHFDSTHRVVTRKFVEKMKTSKKVKYNMRRVDFEDHSSELASPLMKIWKEVSKHSSAWPFKTAVDDSVPDYHSIIKYPMDLEKIEKRIKGRYYTNLYMFHSDMRRIFRNCRLFNADGSEYHQHADSLEAHYETVLKGAELVRNATATVTVTTVSTKSSSKDPPVLHIK